MRKLAFDTQYDLPNPQHTEWNQLAYTDKYGTEQEIKFGYTRENYKFTGWNTKADGTGISFTYTEEYGHVFAKPKIRLSDIFDQVKFQFGNQLVLYAQWKYDGRLICRTSIRCQVEFRSKIIAFRLLYLILMHYNVTYRIIVFICQCLCIVKIVFCYFICCIR